MQAVRELRARLTEAEETLHAIQGGEVDAFVVRTRHGDRVFTLQGATGIGRASANQISIDDPFVSAEHARLASRDGQLWIEDLHSTNGTFVNRRQIASPTPLQPGDVVQVGQVKLKLLR